MKFYFDVPSEIESIEPVLTVAGPVSDKDMLLAVEVQVPELPTAARDAALRNYTLSPKLEAHYCYLNATADTEAKQTFPPVLLQPVAGHAAQTGQAAHLRLNVQVLPWVLQASEAEVAARVRAIGLRCTTAFGESIIHPLPAEEQ